MLVLLKIAREMVRSIREFILKVHWLKNWVIVEETLRWRCSIPSILPAVEKIGSMLQSAEIRENKKN